MDNSLLALVNAIKKIILQLKPQDKALSFLLLTGRDNQGKKNLLRQSQLQHHVVHGEQDIELYYNHHGIIVELGESWLNNSHHLLQHTLKQLNRCHPAFKISGIFLCVDVNELFHTDSVFLIEQTKAHVQLLQRFGEALDYKIEVSILFTKLDRLAGFCEFFQHEHENNLKKPLGFSLNMASNQQQILTTFNIQFEQLIEMLGQQVINKMHPTRSSVQRTLIREFPLQLASLRVAIQTLVQNISHHQFRLNALYFTSAKQGGISQDRLNKKIQHEYALSVQDHFHQSINYRPYFIEGAIITFQQHTKHHLPTVSIPPKWLIATTTSIIALSMIWLIHHHFRSSHLLDEASKELLNYETLTQQTEDRSPAIYHLTKAASALEHITADSLSLPALHQLKTRIKLNTEKHVQDHFLPSMLEDIEQVLLNSKQSHALQYEALKIYLMLGNTRLFERKIVINWFKNRWSKSPEEHLKKKLSLLQYVLKEPFQAIPINRQLVSDVRNYLNALPLGYLYYSLAKARLPQDKQTVKIDGFQLAALEIPTYFTKKGFKYTIAELTNIGQSLKHENWILERQDLTQLEDVLQQAYCYEYVNWWQLFIRNSTPKHYQSYQQARELIEQLQQNNSFQQFAQFIQEQTGPEFGPHAELFNRDIASKFTSLTLLSHSTLQDLSINMSEFQKLLSALAVINDQGKTAFTLTKSQFSGAHLGNPLNSLYQKTEQLPEPMSGWVKQLADDAWTLLIQETRHFINYQWQNTIYPTYQLNIAKHYPFENLERNDVDLEHFNDFFAPEGLLNQFLSFYIMPFLDTREAQWQPKEFNQFVLPISQDIINELMRANVITNMFFPNQRQQTSHIEFKLRKISLDPLIARFQLHVGRTQLDDDQNSESVVDFTWPQLNAKLKLNSIEGKQYELEETGPWALFKLLQKVNVLVDETDSTSLQVLFEINGNSGRYILKTKNKVNPFTPGILNGFTLPHQIV